jgi:hypothetical protein
VELHDIRAPETLRIFIGHDPKEPVCFHVCAESIIRHASMPVQITPLALGNFRHFYNEGHRDGSNDFIYTRYLIPYLCDWHGMAVYLDGDMLLRSDICELLALATGTAGVWVVKHDYRTKYPVKYLGARNDDYPRKNWSSVVLWRCGFFPNRVLTPSFVMRQTGAYLHRFAWLKDSQIGELPPEWNHLTMEYEPNPKAKLYHYTVGAPCFPQYSEQEGAAEWFATLKESLVPLPY